MLEDANGQNLEAGMPPLSDAGPPTSYFEFWPMPLFYAPVAAYCVYLSLRYGGLTLPTAANPGLPLGGLVGESKAQVFDAMGPFARSFVPPFVRIVKNNGSAATSQTRVDALDAINAANLTLPLVAKPDISCRGAGVKVIKTEADLSAYIAHFPGGGAFLLQTIVDKPGEAGIFYVRMPNDEQGALPSLTLKYFPSVVGDGTRSLQQLIEDDPRAGRLTHIYFPRLQAELHRVLAPGECKRLVFAGNHAAGTIFRNGTPFVTPALTERIDKIAKDIDGFFFGRIDVRFDDFDNFLAGEDISIIEVNGAGGEQTHIWDANTKLLDAYKALFSQYKDLYRIGAANRALGHKCSTLYDVWCANQLEKRLTKNYAFPD